MFRCEMCRKVSESCESPMTLYRFKNIQHKVIRSDGIVIYKPGRLIKQVMTVCKDCYKNRNSGWRNIINKKIS